MVMWEYLRVGVSECVMAKFFLRRLVKILHINLDMIAGKQFAARWLDDAIV